MNRLFDWVADMSPFRFALLVIAIFACATAWAWSLGTSQPPESQPWSPMTVGQPVETSVEP